MPFTPGANDGTLNGTSEVTVVAAPGAGVMRTVRNINVYNADNAAITLYLKYVHGASKRTLAKVTVGVGETFIYEEALILDDTDKSIIALLGGAKSSTDPDFMTAYADYS